MTNPTFFEIPNSSGRLLGAEAVVKLGSQEVQLAFRIDGRGEDFRVDVRKPLFPMWEAIDNGEGFPTALAAKRHVRTWLRAAQAQQDLTPSIGEQAPLEPDEIDAIGRQLGVLP